MVLEDIVLADLVAVVMEDLPQQVIPTLVSRMEVIIFQLRELSQLLGMDM
jgi:hypothetical protein